MTTIGYNDIENVLLSLTDPNTWSAVTSVPWVNSPKINAVTSIYNEQGWGSGIAWWSTDINWYALDYNTVSWWSGSVYLPDWTTLTVSNWNTGNMSSTTYIYYDREDDTVKTTTTASDSVWEKKILLCVAAPTTSWKDAEFQAFGTDKQSTFITADNIAANTITANEIAGNTITASEIASGAITTNKIAAWAVDTTQLADYSVVADKMYVSQLSAIAADLWSITAWTITWVTITASDWSTSIILNPSSWEIQIKRWSTVVGRIKWWYESWVWNYMWLIGTNTAVDWTLWCLGRLRIPVWTNLY